MHKISVWLSIAFAFILILPIANVNAQYQKCYDDQFDFLLSTSSEKSMPINVMDPEITQFIGSICYYIHEKTGQWYTYESANRSPETFHKYIVEFYTKYDVPNSIIELFVSGD